MNMQTSLQDKILNFAIGEIGFDDCRFTGIDLSGHLAYYEDWLASGLHGDMQYLHDHLKFKKNPGLLLPGVRSAIVVIKNYKNTPDRQLKGPFKIARYAVGKDYHLTMQENLKKLADFLTSPPPGGGEVKCYYGVDSRPLAERSLAIKAGIGFQGKNTMVIKPGLGSYFFIGVILTTISFEEDKPLKWNCGECRLCLDACPTQAITEPYHLDATKCISYRTIEKKTPMSRQEIKEAKGWLFGCDICQEVCPYNHVRTPLTDWAEFRPEAGVGFDFFEQNPDLKPEDIPIATPLYRSRHRIIPNIRMSRPV